jgi:prevent-host-death family protein
MEAVADHDAMTRLAELLDRVAQGEEIRITKQGRAIARLVPEPLASPMSVSDAIAAIRELRRGNELGPDSTLRQLIDEGRR